MPDSTDTSSKVCWLLIMWQWATIFYYKLCSVNFYNTGTYIGRSAFIYEFWGWSFGTWLKWCSEAVEVVSEWSES
jgi:hypothetical protein